MKINTKILIKTGSLLVVTCLAIGAIRFLGSIPQVKEAVVLATTVKPETFTELYFEDHTNLPKEFSSNKTYSFSFTIHNLEYKDFTYQYEVRSIDELGFSLLQKDSITLKHDEFRTIPVSFKTLKVESNRFQVEVKILDKNQTIHFWMEEKAS